MSQRLRSLRTLLGTQVGQDRLLHRLVARVEPGLLLAAGLHRATLGRRIRLVAITGSFGKSTTFRAVLAALGLTEGRLAGNIAGFICLHLVRRRPWQRWAVYEVSGHAPGVMAPIAGVLRPDVAVVTTIGSEHLRSLGTLEATRTEKFALVRALRPGGLAVLNGDDPHVRWMRDQTTARVVSFGFGPDNQVRASDYALDWPRGSRFTLHLDGQTRPVQTRLVGRHQVYPILAALAVARHAGVPLERAIEAVGQLAPTPGRLEIVPLPNGAHLLRDDYKGTIETIEVALEALEEVPAGRKIVVLGDISEPPADRYAAYRRIGERVGRLAERVVCVGEHARRYHSGFWAGGLTREQVFHAARGVRRAIELVGPLQPGDVVLVKGQGTQRLERVALALSGRTVRCDLSYCPLTMPRCTACAWLEREWQAQPALRAPDRRQAAGRGRDGESSPTPASGSAR